MRPHASPLLLSIALSTTAAAAPRPSASGDLFVGGGYDTNLFLLTAASPDSPTYRPYEGWVARVAPSGAAALAGEDLRFELRASADIRQTFGSGKLFIEDAQFGVVRPDVGPFDLRLALTGGRFDATVDGSLRFSSLGGLGLATWRIVERWRAIVSYSLNQRWYGAPSQIGVDRDFAQQAELRVTFAPGPAMDLAASVYLDLRSTANSDLSTAATAAAAGRVDRAWGSVDVGYLLAPRTSFSGSLWVGTIRTDGAATDLQLGASAAVSVRLLGSVDALGRYDALVDRRMGEASALSPFQRHVVMVGLVVHAAATRREPPRPTRNPRSDAPLVAGGAVRFTLGAPGASSVVVVGSWNDWATGVAGQTLQRTLDGGRWEATVKLPPGQYRYRFVRDGRAVRPPDADRYRQDDFGGEDGIVEVAP